MASVSTLINNISKHILGPLIFMMFGAATVVFLWGVQNFITGASNPEKRSAGAQQMLWGILGMVIMIAAMALKDIIAGTVKIL